MAQIVIADVDRVILQTPTPRLQLLQRGEWDAFAKDWTKDPPNRRIIKILQLLYARGLEVHLHCPRGEATREATEEQLWKYNVPHDKLLLRPEGNTDHSYILKRDWLTGAAGAPYNPSQVFCVFDDDTRAVKMYRQRGFLCLQVQQDPVVDQQTTKANLHARTAVLAKIDALQQA